MNRSATSIFFACALASSNLFLFSNESSLDQYLSDRGFDLSPQSETNEGFSSNSQRLAFIKECQAIPHLKKVLEIGFNAGHSCEAFLHINDDITVVSFDINLHPYTQTGVDFMYRQYPERFTFISGNSATTVNAYAKENPNEKFDLIFIDGSHEFHAVLADIMNCQKFAHPNTLVWLDDYPYIPGVTQAVQFCIYEGVLEILGVKCVNDGHAGPRSWAIAKYNNTQN